MTTIPIIIRKTLLSEKTFLNFFINITNKIIVRINETHNTIEDSKAADEDII